MEVLVIGAGPNPGADAAAVTREVAARLPEGRPGRVVLVAHCPDDTADEPFPVPAHRVGPTLIDWAARGLTWAQTRTELDALRDGLLDVDGVAALRHAGASVLHGRVTLHGRGRVSIESTATGQTSWLAPSRMVLAAGAAPVVPSIPGITQTRYLTTQTLLDLPSLPNSVVILGAGPIGCELAQGLARLGATVTLVESQPRVLPEEDASAAWLVERALLADGVRLIVGARVASVAPTLDGGAWVGIDNGSDVAAEAFVVAGGRRPKLAGLDLAVAGVEVTAAGAVKVDDRLRTTNPDILASGEITGLPVHGTSSGPMARLVAANTVSRRSALRWAQPAAIRVTRTDPALVQVGPVPPELRDSPAHPPQNSRDLFDAVLDDGSTVGACAGPTPLDSVAVVVGSAPGRGVLGLGGPSGRILLGATLVGQGASEAAGQLVIAAAAGLPAAALIDINAPDGTWAAAVQVAVAQALAAKG